MPGLGCRDGVASAFYALYAADQTTTAPVVVLLHGGAWDFVTAPSTSAPLEGDHFAGENRLTASWASTEVMRVLGLADGSPSSEQNDGTLVAAALNNDAFVVMPANCWGDLWHNEDFTSPNDWDADGGVHRNGRALARLAAPFLHEDSWLEDRGIRGLPLTLDASRPRVASLGDGGRGGVELLVAAGDKRARVLLDSSLDDLGCYHDASCPDPTGGHVIGLSRIFGVDASGASLVDAMSASPGIDAVVYYSSVDPLVPSAAQRRIEAAQAAGTFEDALSLIDTGEAEHTSLNHDYARAEDAMTFLLR